MWLSLRATKACPILLSSFHVIWLLNFSKSYVFILLEKSSEQTKHFKEWKFNLLLFSSPRDPHRQGPFLLTYLLYQARSLSSWGPPFPHFRFPCFHFNSQARLKSLGCFVLRDGIENLQQLVSPLEREDLGRHETGGHCPEWVNLGSSWGIQGMENSLSRNQTTTFVF